MAIERGEEGKNKSECFGLGFFFLNGFINSLGAESGAAAAAAQNTLVGKKRKWSK